MTEDTKAKPAAEAEDGAGEPHPEDCTCGCKDPADDARSRFRSRAEYTAEQLRRAAHEVLDGVLRHTPPEFVEHVNNSRKELLLAVRSLIDHELQAIDRCTDRAKSLHTARAAEPKSGGSA